MVTPDTPNTPSLRAWQGTTIDTVFAGTYPILTMGYHEVKIYFIFRQSYALPVHLTSNFFENLLSILNEINNNIQFTNQTRLPSLDIMINKTGTKIWIDFTSSQQILPRRCLTVLSPEKNIYYCCEMEIDAKLVHYFCPSLFYTQENPNLVFVLSMIILLSHMFTWKYVKPRK